MIKVKDELLPASTPALNAHILNISSVWMLVDVIQWTQLQYSVRVHLL